jgi:hypothetical protein
MTERVSRFETSDYPSGVFLDNVRKHTLRILTRIAQLSWDKIGNLLDREKIERLAWLHDIPEVANLAEGRDSLHVADKTSVQKAADSRLAAVEEEKERKFAKEHFASEDFALYAQLGRAGEFLKGSGVSIDSPAHLYL